MAKSGYTACRCPECFDVAVSDYMDEPDFCNECEDAGCDGEGSCEREMCDEGCESDDIHDRPTIPAPLGLQ